MKASAGPLRLVPQPLAKAFGRRLPIARSRLERSRRARLVRPTTENVRRLPLYVQRFDRAVADAYLEQIGDVSRPSTRAGCVNGARPCPWVSCRHHLYLDIDASNGSIKRNFPDIEPHEMSASCSLDIADEGGAQLEIVGDAMNITRERARQIEVKALGRVQKRAQLGPLRDYAEGRVPTNVKTGSVGAWGEVVQAPIAEEAPESEIDESPRKIWDLQREETSGRVSAASMAVFRSYMNDSIVNGFEAVDSVARERLAAVEERMSTVPLERVSLAGEDFEEDEHGVDRAEPRRERASSAQTLPQPAASAAPTEKRMPESRIEEVFALVAKGVTRTAEIADQIGIHKNVINRYLRALSEAGRVETTGAGRTTAYHVKGKAPAPTTPSGAKAPRAAKPKKKTATAMVHVPKVKDLEAAPASSGARFTLRYFEAHVDCASAQDVAQLLAALKGVFS